MVLLFSLRSVLSKNFNSSIWHGDSVTNSNTWFSEPFKAKTCKVFNVSFKWDNNDDNSDFKIQLYVMYNSEIMEYLKDFKHVVKEEVKSWFCTGIPADLVVFSSKNWYLKKAQFESKLVLCSKHKSIILLDKKTTYQSLNKFKFSIFLREAIRSLGSDLLTVEIFRGITLANIGMLDWFRGAKL